MKTMEEYKAFLASVREATGLDMITPDEDGLVSLRIDDTYNLSLQFVAPSGMVLCFVEVAALPKDAPKAVYRELLSAGLFGQDTAGGYFNLEPQSETVLYNYFFKGEEAAEDPDDFVSMLEKILQLCDAWAQRIRSILDGTADTAQAENQGGWQLFA